MIAVFNALLYLITLFSYYQKYKKIDVYFIIILVYSITASLCVVTVYKEPIKWQNLSIVGLLYIYVIVLIMSSVFRGFDVDLKDVRIINSKYTRFVIYLYILSSLFVVITSYQDVIMRFQENAWNSLRNEVYMDEGNISLYDSPLQRITKNICSYLSPLAIVYAFYLLTIEKINTKLAIALFAAILLPSFMAATAVASRGMIMAIVLKMAMAYLLFRTKIPSRRKKHIISSALALVALLSIYVILVSISRFGEDDYKSSMMFYFGHSMLSFSQNIFGRLHDYLNGEYFFYWFMHDNGNVTSIDLATLGSTHGTSFITFVGPLYADFGGIGAMLFAIFAYFFFAMFSKKRVVQLPDLIMLFFYMAYLVNGIFCPGTSGGLRLIMVTIVSLIVRFTERKKII